MANKASPQRGSPRRKREKSGGENVFSDPGREIGAAIEEHLSPRRNREKVTGMEENKAINLDSKTKVIYISYFILI